MTGNAENCKIAVTLLVVLFSLCLSSHMQDNILPTYSLGWMDTITHSLQSYLSSRNTFLSFSFPFVILSRSKTLCLNSEFRQNRTMYITKGTVTHTANRNKIVVINPKFMKLQINNTIIHETIAVIGYLNNLLK